MSDYQFINNYLEDFSQLLKPNDEIIESLIQIRDILLDAKKNRKKVLIFGNGGSSAIASHFTVDMTKNFNLPCLNFNEAALITCFANDYGYEQVEQHVMNSEFHEFIDLIHEENLLLTGGTVLANKDYFCNETFMLAHADNLSICDYKDFITSHYSRPEGTVITMMTYLSDNPESCGIIEIDEFGVVQKFHEKVKIPPSNIANAAVYIIEPSIIDFMTKLNKQEIDFSTEVIPAFLGGINTYHNDIYHRDIGTLESYCLSQIEYYKMSVEDVDAFEY